MAGLAVSPLHDVRHSLHEAARPEVFLGEVPLLGLDKQEVLSGVVKVGDVQVYLLVSIGWISFLEKMFKIVAKNHLKKLFFILIFVEMLWFVCQCGPDQSAGGPSHWQ